MRDTNVLLSPEELEYKIQKFLARKDEKYPKLRRTSISDIRDREQRTWKHIPQHLALVR